MDKEIGETLAEIRNEAGLTHDRWPKKWGVTRRASPVSNQVTERVMIWPHISTRLEHHAPKRS